MKWKNCHPKGTTILANKLILAARTFCRDIFELLDSKKCYEAKAFLPWAEHPQSLIDGIQYSCDYRGAFCHLPL
jgi:hypothetical protein